MPELHLAPVDGDPDGHADGHADGDPDGDADRDADRDLDRDLDRDADSQHTRQRAAAPRMHADHGDPDGDADRDPDGDPDGDADREQHAVRAENGLLAASAEQNNGLALVLAEDVPKLAIEIIYLIRIRRWTPP